MSLRRLGPLALLLPLLLPAPASAQKVEETFFNSVIPIRVDHLIGFAPTTFGIHPRDEPLRPISVQSGGRRYRFIFGNAAAAVGPSATIYMRNMIQDRRTPGPAGVFLDRRMTAFERRHMQVRADLGRDADVLAATRDHPACATGVSRAAAQGIAAGRIRTWSAAGVPAPASGDAIALRRATAASDTVEPRFGASYKLPAGARAARDGGLGEAASGRTAIAAVTSWSRARSYAGSTCAVPIAGTAPTDASVRALSHPDAYPIHFVVVRQARATAHVRAVTAAFLQFLTGPRGTTQFRRRGMLLVRDAWPALPGPPAPQPQPQESQQEPQEPQDPAPQDPGPTGGDPGDTPA